MKACAFCTLHSERIIDSSPSGLVVRDGFPVTPGHTLIIPKRHLAFFFKLEAEERSELLALLDKAKAVLTASSHLGYDQHETTGFPRCPRSMQ
jgi:diadenosine tetraphosphate (Ap4A) HIT family hydrolase